MQDIRIQDMPRDGAHFCILVGILRDGAISVCELAQPHFWPLPPPGTHRPGLSPAPLPASSYEVGTTG